MKITSSFEDYSMIPRAYTCKGENIHPPFVFREIPEGTQSLLLVVKDEDASPKPWIHWLIYNIPLHTYEVAEGKPVEGAQLGICNGGTFGYEGPCPIYFRGRHRYTFKLIAIDTVLDVPVEADWEVVSQAIKGHVLEKAVLHGFSEGTGEQA